MNCSRKYPYGVGQHLFTQSGGWIKTRSSKFYPEILRELLVVEIIKHDLPFQFVGYEGIMVYFPLCVRMLN